MKPIAFSAGSGSPLYSCHRDDPAAADANRCLARSFDTFQPESSIQQNAELLPVQAAVPEDFV
jgi:hypothetical protein